MTAVEPVQAGPYPLPADAPDGPNQMAAIVVWAAGRLVMRFASTTARDSAIPAPTQGMIAVTGADAALVTWQYRNGAWRNVTLGTPTAYTPTLGPSATAYTAAGRYVRNGMGLLVWFTVTCGAGFSIAAGTLTVSLPMAVNPGIGGTSGAVRFYDASSGNSFLGARVAAASSTDMSFQVATTYGGALNNASGTFPWVLASGDIIDGFAVLEVA